MGLFRALLGCRWGKDVHVHGQPFEECHKTATDIVVVHYQGHELTYKLCAEHRDRVLGVTTPRSPDE